jgi:hypothetical protein
MEIDSLKRLSVNRDGAKARRLAAKKGEDDLLKQPRYSSRFLAFAVVFETPGQEEIGKFDTARRA